MKCLWHTGHCVVGDDDMYDDDDEMKVAVAHVGQRNKVEKENETLIKQ